MATTTTDENKELVREYLAEWEHEEPNTISALLAEDFSATYTDAAGTDVELDIADFEELVAGWFEAFSEYTTEVHEMVAEGDQVMTRITVSGVHDGEFLGVPATGNHTEVEEFLSFRIEDGEITEMHYLGDNLDLLRQHDVELPIEAVKQPTHARVYQHPGIDRAGR